MLSPQAQSNQFKGSGLWLEAHMLLMSSCDGYLKQILVRFLLVFPARATV